MGDRFDVFLGPNGVGPELVDTLWRKAKVAHHRNARHQNPADGFLHFRAAFQFDGMGARLQAVRGERAITKAELGRLARLTAPSITQIENGGQSGVEVIEALAQALGVSPGWLAFGVGPQVLPSRRRPRQAPLP